MNEEQTARFVRHGTRIIFDRRETHRTQLKADSQAEADELIEILNALEARAALADEIGIGGYRHSKATWADWLARYDALTKGAQE